MRKTIAVCLFAIAGTSLAMAAGDWNDAQDKVRTFEKEHADLRRLTPRETRRIVDAICRADETERKDAAKTAGTRAKDKVTGKYSDLEKLKDDAVKALDDVIADSSLSGHHENARDHKKKLTRHWKSIGKMTKSVRGANHPVIAYMLDQGNQAHLDYQKDTSKCDVYELPMSMSKGRADCLKADGTTCTVIELKPDNMNAINKGRLQASRYARELRSKGDAYKNLVKKDRKFGACTKFSTRVDCYTLCPKIDADGNFARASPSWRTDC